MINGIHLNVNNLKESIPKLKIGDQVFLTGKVYTARDAAHKRLVAMIMNKKDLPINVRNAVIYYTGPTPRKPGSVIGSCGPTTSYRMDGYLLPLLKLGLVGTIGKGERSKEANELIRSYGSVYFSAIGGAGALACKYVESMKEVAFLDLGCESIKELYVNDFPVIVTAV